MKKKHDHGLRPYHNPENIDESLVPDGWRFRYADEMQFYRGKKCRLWVPTHHDWSATKARGMYPLWTYIVPITP